MQKPEKPSPDFPLYAHNSGRWAKKVQGRTVYFGPWDRPQESLEAWNREKKQWESGDNPRVKVEVASIQNFKGIRLGDGCNLFLSDCLKRVARKEINQRSYDDYKAAAKRLLKGMDRYYPIESLGPDDWHKGYLALAKNNGPKTTGNLITRVKVIMNWLRTNRYIEHEPYYGSGFKKPSKSTVRRARANSGKRWFSKEEINLLLTTHHATMKAMILLGINCGFGNGDCSMLKFPWINLETGWIEYDRPKTGVPRRAKLWPETIEALKASIETRPKVNLPWVFVTRAGNQWSDPNSANCAISRWFGLLMEDKKIHIPGRGFYGLRRTFETIGGDSRDQVAVDFIMGHCDESMSGVYRQEVFSERLEIVANHVRKWLFG